MGSHLLSNRPLWLLSVENGFKPQDEATDTAVATLQMRKDGSLAWVIAVGKEASIRQFEMCFGDKISKCWW